MHDLLLVAGPAVSFLLSIVLGLLQYQWRTTVTSLDQRFDYERKRLDDVTIHLNNHALQLAAYSVAKDSTLQRLETIENEFTIFRRELANISQALVRIETLMRKSTPPPRGG